MSLNSQEIVSVIYLSFALLFTLYLLSSQNQRKISNRLLAAFFTLELMDAGGRLYSSIYDHYPALGLLLNSLVFIKLPILYLYVLSVIYSDFVLKFKHLWHLSGYIIVTLGFFPEFYSLSRETQLNLMDSGEFKHLKARYFSYALIHLQIFFYFFLIFKRIAHFRIILKENYSSEKALSYKWVLQLSYLFALIALIATVKNILLFFGNPKIFEYAQWATVFIACNLVAWIVIKGIHSPELFTGVKQSLKSANQMLSENIDQASDTIPILTPEEENQLSEIDLLIQKEKYYTNPELSLAGLANQLNIPTRSLSILINHKKGQHFFDFINQYRIEEAKKLLKDPKQNLTIQQIFFQVGFNSKSSFNTAFKRFTGTTPSDYKKEASAR